MRQLLSLVFVIAAGTTMAQTALPTFDEVDTDADGALTQEEVDTALQGFDFTAADLDQNNLLTRDEYNMGIRQQTGGNETTR